MEQIGFSPEGDFTPNYSLRVSIRNFMKRNNLSAVVTRTRDNHPRYTCYVVYKNTIYFCKASANSNISLDYLDSLKSISEQHGRSESQDVVIDDEDVIFSLFPALREILSQ